MRFLVHKRRHAPAVIIVALIDVLIVLLIFLMVTTTFKQQAALKLTLPESAQAKKEGATENPPMVVSIDTNGLYFVDKQSKTLEELKRELTARAASNPKLIVAINADEKAPWGQVVKVRDLAAAAGIKTLVAYTREAPKP